MKFLPTPAVHRPGLSLTRRIKVWLLATVAIAASVLVAAPAMADHGIYTTATVNVRSGPSTGYAVIGTVPSGASPTYHCWTQGQNINGVDVWFNMTYGSVTGYISSYYDNSSYSTDAAITSKYGIPNCSTATSTPTGAQKAINWAAARVGSTSYQGLCLTFVFDAYNYGAGVNLRYQVNYPIGSNTYPVDIWGKFTRGTTGTGTPPAGALVFYASTTGDRTLSHVVLSVGGGNTISTADRIATPIHYETVAQHYYAKYLGWWLPAS